MLAIEQSAFNRRADNQIPFRPGHRSRLYYLRSTREEWSAKQSLNSVDDVAARADAKAVGHANEIKLRWKVI